MMQMGTGTMRSLIYPRQARTWRISSWDQTGRNRDFVSVQTGETVVLADIQGPGCINHIWVTINAEDPLYLRQAVLRMFWDDETAPSVESPLGDFSVAGPDELWVADLTYIATWAGFLYLAVVVDAWSRRVVGWAMATHLRTELVLDALEMAIRQRRPVRVVHHSDQGSQYTSLAFGKRCREAGVRPSMGSVGDCYASALCESFFATLECELLDRRSLRSREEARQAVFQFIEGWYNPHRRHSSLGYVSPMRFELVHAHAA